MSLNSLTNEELVHHKAGAAKRSKAKGAPAPNSTAVQENPVNSALNILIKYIPTEVITLYVAALSITPANYLEELYIGFGVLTPILFLLVYINKLVTDNEPVPTLKEWPWFKIIASCIGFLVWALAVPNNPYTANNTAALAWAGFAALLVSTILSLIEPIVSRKPQT